MFANGPFPYTRRKEAVLTVIGVTLVAIGHVLNIRPDLLERVNLLRR